MNAVEKARLRRGNRIKWRGRFFSYVGYGYRAHTLKEHGVSVMVENLPLCYTYPSEITSKWPVPEPTIEAGPVYEHLSNAEIMNAEVVRG